MAMSKVFITSLPLVARETQFNEAAGAVIDFWGVVRRSEEGREIEGLEYEAHPTMAQHQLELLAERVVAEFGLLDFILEHRIGFVPVAESSLFVRVASARRDAAFAASKWTIEELKRKVPIWKRPRFRPEGIVLPSRLSA